MAEDERHRWRSHLRVWIKHTVLIRWKWRTCRFTSGLLAPAAHVFGEFVANALDLWTRDCLELSGRAHCLRLYAIRRRGTVSACGWVTERKSEGKILTNMGNLPSGGLEKWPRFCRENAALVRIRYCVSGLSRLPWQPLNAFHEEV